MQLVRMGSLVVCLVAGLVLPARGQNAPGSDKIVSGRIPELDSLSGPPGFGAGEKVLVSARLIGSHTPRRATLWVTATMEPGRHIYSITQKAGGPIRTTIELAPSKDYKLAGDWAANAKPKIHREEFWPGLDVEEHDGVVTWSAPVEISEGVDVAKVSVKGSVSGQVCKEVCENFKSAFQAAYSPPEKATKYRAPNSHTEITGRVAAKAVAPGSTVKLTLTASPDDKWHVNPLAAIEPKEAGSRPTLIVFTGDTARLASKPSTDAKIVEGKLGPHHEGSVTWTSEIKIPADAKPGSRLPITGLIGYQTCQVQCELKGANFAAELPIAEKTEAGETELTFLPAVYNDIAKAAAEAQQQSSIDWSGLGVQLGLAFLAGLILNVMPCVLPVIGLKIMSFVHQAGHNRWQVFLLNLWYVAGLMSVFLVLAALTAETGQGWGAHFQSTTFTIVMASIVFVCALSFLGVWEIPIPGFVGSGAASELAAKEGAVGAFAKGVLTTVLATPCTGPFLVPAITWSLSQPPAVVYAMFTAVGLGMASPYLVIGAYPKLVSRLPKPGPWMETFKQAMGFVLLGTVVFILNSFSNQPQYFIPVLAFLVGLWAACWWIGRTPMTVSPTRRLRAWAGAAVFAVLIGFLSFGLLLHGEQLPWQPYSRATLEDQRAKGATVLVDFTADW